MAEVFEMDEAISGGVSPDNSDGSGS